MNASAEPVKIETSEGTNCVLSRAWDNWFPPLIVRKPQVIIMKTIVATVILKILGNLFIVCQLVCVYFCLLHKIIIFILQKKQNSEL